MEKPQKENIQVAYGVDANTGLPSVIVKIEGQDKYLLTPGQADALGRAFIEKAGFARYEAAAYAVIVNGGGCIDGAKSIINKFRNAIERMRINKN